MQKVVVHTPTLFWVDLSRGVNPSDEVFRFKHFFNIHHRSYNDLSQDNVIKENVDSILFEYDYPDRAGLEILRKTKESFPHIPIIMLTEQHSEALAVWALHARVLDYLVKPVESWRLGKLSSVLQQLTTLKNNNYEKRVPLNRDEAIPFEARIGNFIADANSVKIAANYIEKHLDQTISCQSLAKLCNMAPRKFSDTFKKAYGVSFQRYQLQRRLDEAARLLEHPDSPIADIAYTVGFCNPSYFTKEFKNEFNITPKQYRESKLQEAQQPKEFSNNVFQNELYFMSSYTNHS